MSKLHNDKYKKLSEDYGIPIHVVKAMVESQFSFTRETIMQGDDKPVRLQFLGKFEVKEGKRDKVRIRREWAKKIRDEKNRQKK
tara:strand:- start:13757 stop:14008 length:252 start_codon:yes stop_codon:yes gene_type:complete